MRPDHGAGLRVQGQGRGRKRFHCQCLLLELAGARKRVGEKKGDGLINTRRERSIMTETKKQRRKEMGRILLPANCFGGFGVKGNSVRASVFWLQQPFCF